MKDPSRWNNSSRAGTIVGSNLNISFATGIGRHSGATAITIRRHTGHEPSRGPTHKNL